MSNPSSTWNDRAGGCLCGAVRYRISGPPLSLIACHCSDCQVRSGGAFSLSLVTPDAHMEVLQGEPVALVSQHDGREKRRMVCEACHTGVWITNSGTPGIVIVKAGTLDQRTDLRPVAHIWLRSRQPWFPIPDAVLQYDMQPSDYGPVLQAWTRQLEAE